MLSDKEGDPFVYSSYARDDMPPFKGGKIQKVTTAAGTFACTTGFIFELNGSGEQPLRVGTAGHCTQGVQTVSDGQADAVGTTLTPNLLRMAGSPAPADAVFWDPDGARSDVSNYVIQDTSTQVRVDAGYTPSGVSLGDTVCRTGYASGTDCGNLLVKNQDYTLHYQDLSNGGLDPLSWTR
jgi:hypothetical protein